MDRQGRIGRKDVAGVGRRGWSPRRVARSHKQIAKSSAKPSTKLPQRNVAEPPAKYFAKTFAKTSASHCDSAPKRTNVERGQIAKGFAKGFAMIKQNE